MRDKRSEKETEMEKTEMKIAKSRNLVSTRGRSFLGIVTKKFPTRVVLELERTVFLPKYERYLKKKTRLHARIPNGMKVNEGDLIRIQECRPLSKIIHFLIIDIIKQADSKEEKK
jgi:small subunit ribosomal protein S17